MSLSGRQQQHISDGAADAEIRVCSDAGPAGDLICRPETDAVHLIRQTVRILLQYPVNLVPVFSIQLHRHIVGNAILLQEHHGLAHVLLLFQLGRDLPGLFLTDALDLRQPLRLFLNDAERLALEVSDDPGRQRRADALNGTAAQIPLHGHLVLRCLQLVGFDEQLLPVHGMLL